MIQVTAYGARCQMPDVTDLHGLRELVKWMDESWADAKLDTEAWNLHGTDAEVVKLKITIEEEQQEARA
jgi:hypothetical protein